MPRDESNEDEFDEEPFDDESFDEIDGTEREALQQDLIDVRTLKRALGSRGIRGIMVWCPDCEEDHFLGWDLLAENLQQILVSGEPPVHEPAWEPDPDEYVGWDYARGFLDGLETERESVSLDRCAFCGLELPTAPYISNYCPKCGRTLAPLKMAILLQRRGWTETEIADLLETVGFHLPSWNLEDLGEFIPDIGSATEEEGRG